MSMRWNLYNYTMEKLTLYFSNCTKLIDRRTLTFPRGTLNGVRKYCYGLISKVSELNSGYETVGLRRK